MKCSACGRVGHRRNSKKCPLYEQNKSKSTKKNPPWKDSDARRELKSILLSDKDRTHLAMPAEELQKLRTSFNVYQKSKFKDYTIALKNEVMKENKNWPEPWKDNKAEEHAKSLFLNDFDTHHAMNTRTFWKLSPLFEQYPFEYFEIRLDRLKKQMAKNKDIVKADEAALRYDRSIIPIKTTTESGDPRWDRHPAKNLLKKDIAENKHKVMTPRELSKSRKEYKDFIKAFSDIRKGKKVFRKHIYQEIYNGKSRAYWEYVNEKNMKEKKKISDAIASISS